MLQLWVWNLALERVNDTVASVVSIMVMREMLESIKEAGYSSWGRKIIKEAHRTLEGKVR